MCNGCNGISFGNHGLLERNCIPSLKSHYYYYFIISITAVNFNSFQSTHIPLSLDMITKDY